MMTIANHIIHVSQKRPIHTPYTCGQLLSNVLCCQSEPLDVVELMGTEKDCSALPGNYARTRAFRIRDTVEYPQSRCWYISLKYRELISVMSLCCDNYQISRPSTPANTLSLTFRLQVLAGKG